MQNAEVSALRSLMMGLVYLSVATTMLTAAIELTPAIHDFSAMVTAFVVFMLAAVAVTLYAVVRMIRPALRQLSEIDGRFRTPYRGTTLMLAGLAISALGLVLMAALICFAIALAVLFIGAAVASLGHFMTFVEGAFKLYERYRSPLYAIAGVILLLNIFLASILLSTKPVAYIGVSITITAVGYALIVAAIGRTIERRN